MFCTLDEHGRIQNRDNANAPSAWMTSGRMFRVVVAKRRFCSSTNGTTTLSLGKRVSAELEKLMVCQPHSIPVCLSVSNFFSHLLIPNECLSSLLVNLLKKDADWVDTDDDKTIDLVVESAGSLINEYRQHYNPNDFDEKLYKKVALLYEAKEAASIVEAYACLAENVMRHHEGMVGHVVGSTLFVNVFSF